MDISLYKHVENKIVWFPITNYDGICLQNKIFIRWQPKKIEISKVLEVTSKLLSTAGIQV